MTNWVQTKIESPAMTRDQMFLVVYRGIVKIANFYTDAEWYDDEGVSLIPSPTHWMPLPQVPEDAIDEN
jgi:hypothetical protein